MNDRFRAGLYAIMIVSLVLAGAFTVIPARADDGAPPPPAEPTQPVTPDPSLNEGAPTDSAPTDVTPTDTASTADTPSGLSQVPAGTDVVVVDRSGHKVALATQEAAHVVADGDPMWCPTGIVPGGAGCHSFTDFSLLLAYIINPVNFVRLSKPGVIWISKDYDSSTISLADIGATDFTLDGDALGNMDLYSLTINGGWKNAGTALNPLDPSVFNGPSLNIINWTGAVTINDVIVENAVSGNGLTISTKGNIIVNNVDAVGNHDDGASLDNCLDDGGAHDCTGTGTVSVNYSTFSGNGNLGLDVKSNRAITVRNITSVHNGVLLSDGKGASLDNFNFGDVTGNIAQPITLTGINTFNSNAGDGLLVLSRGAITLGNMTSLNNGGQGVYLDNCIINGVLNTCDNGKLNLKNVAYNITVKGTNNISGNGVNGLTAWATGLIAVSNLQANGNGTGSNGFGAYLSNFGATLTKKTIKLTGVNMLNGNGSSGLWMDSKGAITVSNITANDNGQDGGCSSGDTCDGLYVGDSASFALTGHGTFTGNNDFGAQILSKGAVTLINMYADHNASYGAYINNCGAPAACTGIGNVTLNGMNVFTNNGKTGLSIDSYGVVTLSNLTASFNGTSHTPGSGSGLFVINCKFNGACDKAIVPNVPHAVTLKGLNNFNGNYVDGLSVYTLGAITASSLTANGNTTGRGAFLDNQWSYKNYNITLTGFNTFNGNGDIGLEAYSNGNITINNLTANDNFGGTTLTLKDGGGAYLDNVSMTTASVLIKLTGFNTFNGNGDSGAGTGLYALSDGAITIYNLSANTNQGYGAYLNDKNVALHHAILLRNITLSGFNSFSYNQNDGLNFTSSGALIAPNVTASFNSNGSTTGYGVNGTAGGVITLTCGSMYYNQLTGLHLTTTKAITLRGVYTGSNVGGADFFSHAPVVVQACATP